MSSLLAQASGAQSFLEAPAVAVADVPLVGRQLGAYRIDERIGAGGMGEVYRARDTKLGRDVALKVLPAAIAWDPDRLARVGREARALAALNHPHIGAIYGVEERGGIRALVLELVDGETLAERLARGPLPVPEAVRVAGQIADALQAAHDKGIVHRDLKPANIKITSSGAAKVLDCGLATATPGDGAETTLATRQGTVMGTPAYMSPEQARGEAVDQRTDVWAFGCVLYEMLTGRRAFAGATASDALAAVLKNEPDWSIPQAAGRSHLIYWVNHEDPARNEIRLLRLDDPRHGASIVRTGNGAVYDRGTLFYDRAGVWVGQPLDLDLARLVGTPRLVATDGPANRGVLATPMFSAEAGHVVIANRRREQLQATWVGRSGIPSGTLGDRGFQTDPEISPDGSRVAVSRAEPGEAESSVWIVDVKTGGRKQLGPSGSQHPIWHRDGTRIALRSSLAPGGGNRSLYQIDPDAARPSRPLLEASANMYPVGWGPGDRFVLFTVALPNTTASLPTGILILDQDPKVTPFTVASEISGARLSPDGTRIAYVLSQTGGRDLFVDTFPVAGPRPVSVAHGAVSRPRWSPDGRELYFVGDGRLMAARVPDGTPLSVETPARLFDVLSQWYAVHPDGKRFLIMVPTSLSSESVKVTFNWPRQ